MALGTHAQRCFFFLLAALVFREARCACVRARCVHKCVQDVAMWLARREPAALVRERRDAKKRVACQRAAPLLGASTREARGAALLLCVSRVSCSAGARFVRVGPRCC